MTTANGVDFLWAAKNVTGLAGCPGREDARVGLRKRRWRPRDLIGEDVEGPRIYCDERHGTVHEMPE